MAAVPALAAAARAALVLAAVARAVLVLGVRRQRLSSDSEPPDNPKS